MKTLLSFLEKITTKQWLIFVVVFKLVLFSFFVVQYQQHYDPERLVGCCAVVTGDSFGYYDAAVALVQGEGYNNFCRMPGVVPFFAPLALILGPESAKVAMIFVQLIISILSIFALAKWAQQIFPFTAVYPITILLYTISSFNSVFDHLLMADSLSISFFIFSLYFLGKSISKQSWKLALLAGLFLAWSVFLRQIILVVYPIVALLFLYSFRRQLITSIVLGVAFVLPLIVSIGAWSQYTVEKTGRRLLLAIPVEECYATYTLQFQELAGLLIDMGYGEPFWTEGSITQWMFRSDTSAVMPVIPQRHFSNAFTPDTLVQIRNDYRIFVGGDRELRNAIGPNLLLRLKNLRASYKSENTLHFYTTNKLRHIQQFIAPGRLENLPGPSLANMSWFEKALKAFYLLLFHLVAPLGIIIFFVLMPSMSNAQRIWSLFPLLIFGALAIGLGYVEQRYFGPIYPLCVVAIAIGVGRIAERSKARLHK